MREEILVLERNVAADLEAAWREASRYGERVIAECLIEGPEYTVGILGNQALPTIRVESDNEFYDYEAKYLSDDTRYLCPCGLDEAEEAEDLGVSPLARGQALRCISSRASSLWGFRFDP